MFGCFPPCKPVVAVLRDSVGIRYIIVLSCVADCCEVERYVLTTIKRIIIIIIIIIVRRMRWICSERVTRGAIINQYQHKAHRYDRTTQSISSSSCFVNQYYTIWQTGSQYISSLTQTDTQEQTATLGDIHADKQHSLIELIGTALLSPLHNAPLDNTGRPPTVVLRHLVSYCLLLLSSMLARPLDIGWGQLRLRLKA